MKLIKCTCCRSILRILTSKDDEDIGEDYVELTISSSKNNMSIIIDKKELLKVLK